MGLRQMEMDRRAAKAWTTWRLILVVGFGIVAALNLPGQLGFDSATALWEGRHHVRMSWGPPMYAAILGAFDALAPGTGLFTVASLTTTALAWAALPLLRGRLAWSGPVLLALVFALPQVLIYQGIVWRDVLFADLTVAAFVALALAARLWTRPGLRWSLLGLAVVALAFGALVRQNGGVVIAPWGLALAWIAARGRWRRGFAWMAAGLAVPLSLAAALSAVNPVHEPPERKYTIDLRLLAHYDLVAALAENPARPFPRMAAERPDALAVLRREAPVTYSPTRIDTLDWNGRLQVKIWRFRAATVNAEWREMIAADPLGYARRRLEVFRWVVLTPRLDLCVPLHLGVSGLPQVLKDIGLVEGRRPRDARLYAYAARWFPTPFYSHLTYGLLAAAVAGLLMIRRDPEDIAIAALMVAVLGFTATFFFVSIACDYRYLYAVDLAAVTGVLYLAVDPRRRRGSGKSP
jgi:hypothetical protein